MTPAPPSPGHVRAAPPAPARRLTLAGAPRLHAVGRAEATAWCAAMATLIALRVALVGGPQFFNDSYQYLSMARNLQAHAAIETSIVHFDEERARGVLPAPETTFPPGYPIALWSLAWTGLPLEWIGLLLGAAAALGVIPLLRAGARALGLGAAATRLSLLLWAVSAQAALYATTLYAEATFTLVVTAALVLLLADGRRARTPSWRAPAAFALVGAAVWLRYAGLFFAVALHLHALHRLVRERRRPARWALALAACDLPVAVLLARNLAVSGSLLGGNSRPVHHGVGWLLHTLGVSGYELALGSIRDPRSLPFGAFALLLCVGLAGALGLGLLARSRAPAASASPTALLPALCGLVYAAALTWAGLRTQISLSARMFVPLLPVLAWGAGALLARPWPGPSARWRNAVLALLAAGYVGANVQSSLAAPRTAEHRWAAAALAVPMQDGRSLRGWVEEHVPRDAVLLSLEGQATGYLLQRRTVSAAGRLFTDLAWDADQARAIARRFGVGWVVVYPEVAMGGGVDALQSPLFRALAAHRPPDWLELAAENPRVLVYRVRG